mmetsp:Transcript_45076/g.106291  ORF Transcript_45076/g.106291 Transcript_45076/m.106291 type:complete len:212 (-) Transcript_45076:150-785(-)
MVRRSASATPRALVTLSELSAGPTAWGECVVSAAAFDSASALPGDSIRPLSTGVLATATSLLAGLTWAVAGTESGDLVAAGRGLGCRTEVFLSLRGCLYTYCDGSSRALATALRKSSIRSDSSTSFWASSNDATDSSSSAMADFASVFPGAAGLNLVSLGSFGCGATLPLAPCAITASPCGWASCGVGLSPSSSSESVCLFMRLASGRSCT